MRLWVELTPPLESAAWIGLDCASPRSPLPMRIFEERPVSSIEALTSEAVREVLHAVHYAQPLSRSPLTDLAIVMDALGQEGMSDKPETRGWALTRLLTDLVTAKLDELREGDGESAWATLTAEQALDGLQADFRSGSMEREAWGALYYRYLAQVEQPVASAARIGISQKMLYRRAKRACEQLAQLLREMERSTNRTSPGSPSGDPWLPMPATALVGRREALAGLQDLLAEFRLLTLTGPGGTGKTRLAVELASDLRKAFEQGTWFVDLSALTDEARVAETVAATLGLREEAGSSIQDRLVQGLRSMHLLLVLDNCEHLLDGTTELVERLLQACPRLRILATSREPLRASGERVWPVPPLHLPEDAATPSGPAEAPEPERLLQASAVRLFVERAAAASADFALTAENAEAVARLCRRLDGLPLAIELSAARVRLLTPEQQLARFDQLLSSPGGGRRQAQSRQETLEGTLDWSYELLNEAERLLFARLAVFRGTWTLAAAESVTSGQGIDRAEVLDLVGRLVDKSLVSASLGAERNRYRLLETIHAYASLKLDQTADRDRLRRRFVDYYTELARSIDRRMHQAEDRQPWLARLDAEHGNLLAALDYAEALGAAEQALQLVACIGWSFYARGRLGEGRALVDRALALPGVEAHPDWLRSALDRAGTLASFQGDLASARQYLQQSLEIAERIGDPEAIVSSLTNLGIEGLRRGDLEMAEACFERTREIAGDIQSNLINLALLSELRGDYPRSREQLAEALAQARREEDRWSIGHALVNLGGIEWRLGERDRARQALEEGLAIKSAFEDRTAMAYGHLILGQIAIDEGDGVEARRQLASSAALSTEAGDRAALIDLLQALARLAQALGQAERAAILQGAAAGWRERLEIEPSPGDAPGLDHQVQEVRNALGTDGYRAASERGRRLGMDAAIRLGLREPDA